MTLIVARGKQARLGEALAFVDHIPAVLPKRRDVRHNFDPGSYDEKNSRRTAAASLVGSVTTSWYRTIVMSQ